MSPIWRFVNWSWNSTYSIPELIFFKGPLLELTENQDRFLGTLYLKLGVSANKCRLNLRGTTYLCSLAPWTRGWNPQGTCMWNCQLCYDTPHCNRCLELLHIHWCLQSLLQYVTIMILQNNTIWHCYITTHIITVSLLLLQ